MTVDLKLLLKLRSNAPAHLLADGYWVEPREALFYDEAWRVLPELDKELTRLREDVTVLRAGVAEALRLLELGGSPSSANCRMNPGSAAELGGDVLRRILTVTDRSKTRT